MAAIVFIFSRSTQGLDHPTFCFSREQSAKAAPSRTVTLLISVNWLPLYRSNHVQHHSYPPNRPKKCSSTGQVNLNGSFGNSPLLHPIVVSNSPWWFLTHRTPSRSPLFSNNEIRHACYSPLVHNGNAWGWVEWEGMRYRRRLFFIFILFLVF